MFKFISENSVIIDEIIYVLCGLVCIMTGIRGLKNKKAPTGTFLFWTLLGLLFCTGKLLINNLEHGGAIVGGLLLVLGALTLTKQVQVGEFEDQSEEQKVNYGKRVGNKIFIPALSIGIIAMIMAQFKSFKVPVGETEAGLVFFGFSSAQTLGFSSIIAIIIAIIITKAKFKETKEDTAKMLMTIGSSSLLPQLLGALGTVFAAAGVGEVIGSGVAAIVPPEAKVLGVIAYCLGMVIFTMIMGNAFAAFTVITLGVGIPFVIANGADPAVIGALGMTCGYCGTLMTPMAANFNIVPAAILETKSEYAIMKAQAPVALSLILVHIILMLVFGF
uniref:DUF979 domain-containing protein n=1 Tax=Ezakiella massiliensis TaxID=1852374 RepID=UPI00094E32ED|nr:DUF979 domain-containing protein [Ezakiella massiliensis]